MAKGQATVYETRYKEHVIKFTPGSGDKPYETDGQAFATEDEAKKHIRATFFDDGEPAVKWPRTEVFEKPSIYGHSMGEQPDALIVVSPRTDYGRYSFRSDEVRTKEKSATGYKAREWAYKSARYLALDTPKNRALIDEVNAIEKQRVAMRDKQQKLIDRLTMLDPKLYGIGKTE